LAFFRAGFRRREEDENLGDQEEKCRDMQGTRRLYHCEEGKTPLQGGPIIGAAISLEKFKDGYWRGPFDRGGRAEQDPDPGQGNSIPTPECFSERRRGTGCWEKAGRDGRRDDSVRTSMTCWTPSRPRGRVKNWKILGSVFSCESPGMMCTERR